MNRRIILLISFLILIYYIWSATGGTNNFYLDRYHGGAYNDLSDSFLSGHLYLLIKPHPELFNLQDPYDPAQNGPYRLHDASLYGGKYYLYFGPTPALVLYIPYRLITGYKLPDNLAVLIFSYGSFIWSTFLLLLLAKKHVNYIPSWMIFLSVAVLGLGNFAPYNLRRTEMYEVAISCSSFFLTGSIYFLIKAFNKEQNKSVFFFIGSLLLGLAVGARPQTILSGFLLPLIALKSNSDKTNIKNFFTKENFSLFIPFILCSILILMYNYLRFDNPFEFGQTYQLAGVKVRDLKFFNIDFLLSGVYSYVFQPPRVDSIFPFVHIITSVPKEFMPRLPYYPERILGILPSVPFILLAIISPIVFWVSMLCKCRVNCDKNEIIIKSVILTILIPFIINILSFVSKVFNSLDLSIFFERLLHISLFFILFSVMFLNIIFWIYKSRRFCGPDCIGRIKFPWFEFIVIFLPGLFNLAILLPMPIGTLRYLQDFVPFFIINTFIIWSYFSLRIDDNSKAKKILNSLAISLSILSILFGMAFGIVGCYSGLVSQNPSLYYEIENGFKPLSNLIHLIAPLWGQE